MRLMMVFVILSTLGCGTVVSKKAREEGRIHMQMGTSYLTQGNYPAALRELLEAERLDPSSAPIQNNLGVVYYTRDKLGEAEKHFRRALQLDPKFTDAKSNLGRVLTDAGNHDAAIPLLEESSRDLTYQNTEKAFLNLGIAYFRKKDYAQAKNRFEQALKSNRSNCLAQSYYGRTLFELKSYLESSRILDQAITICKPMNFDEPHFFSGMSYLRLGVLGKAMARFEEIIKLYPSGKYVSEARTMIDGIH